MGNEKTEMAIVKLAVADYPIMHPERIGEILEAVKENVPDTESLSIFDLITVTAPASNSPGLQVGKPEGVEVVEELDAVILGIKPGRSYWKTAFGKGGGNTPPDCQSSDGVWGIGEPGGECSSCELGQFKGDCRQSTLLLVAVKGELLPWVIRITPGSLGSLGNYLKRVLSVRGIVHWAVLTRFYIVSAKGEGGAPYGQIHCKMLGKLSDVDAAKCKELKQQILGLFGSGKPLPAAEIVSVEAPVNDGSAADAPF